MYIRTINKPIVKQNDEIILDIGSKPYDVYIEPVLHAMIEHYGEQIILRSTGYKSIVTLISVVIELYNRRYIQSIPKTELSFIPVSKTAKALCMLLSISKSSDSELVNNMFPTGD